MEKKSKVLKKLFFSTLYLSTFTFGGGYVIVTLMKNKFVDELHWIDEEEMLDLVAIAQSSPGAIAVNGAIVVGYKLAGLPGVLLSILGAILPPMIILSAISFFYDAFRSNLIVGTMLKGMQSGVAAVIASVVFDMGSNVVKEKDWLNIAIMAASFLISHQRGADYHCGRHHRRCAYAPARKKGGEGMIYLQLFLSFLQIGAFSFGGGYAAMPLIQSQVVDLHGWLTMQEFTDLITISQMTPGPIAVNSATFVGIQIAGPLGALVATLGCILPSCIFVTALAYIYMKYRKMSLLQGILGSLRPAVVSLIAIAGVTILISAVFTNGAVEFRADNVSVRAIIWFIIAVILLRKKKMDPILVMVLCGVFETVCTLVMKWI